MKTLIVNYEHDSDKKKFENENKKALSNYEIIWVNDRNTLGCRVDVLEEIV